MYLCKRKANKFRNLATIIFLNITILGCSFSPINSDSQIIVSKVKFDLSTYGVKKNAGFTTQDSVLTLGIRGTEIAKFQVKGNTTSRLSNLKIEGTGKGEAARLGKAPLALVTKLTAGKPNKAKFMNNATNEPTSKSEFDNRSKEFERMYNELVRNILSIKTFLCQVLISY